MPLSSLFYKIEGRGEPILFLPGLCLNHHLFDETAKFLKDRYKLIFVDLFGTGASPKPKDKYSIVNDALEVLEIVKEFPQLHIIAHSRGVKVALCLSQHYKNFGKCVFVGQAGFGKKDDIFTKNVIEVKNLKLTSRTEIAKKLEDGLNFGKIYGGAETLFKLKKAKEGCDISDSLLRRVEDSPDFKEIAKYFDKTVVIIAGEKDPFLEDIKDAVNYYKQLKIIEVSKSGHFPMIENANEFNFVLKQILNGG
jgi:pimeloyl-ACP methyl ester carboxylesterase